MTQKINGAAYPGIWVEKQVTFVKFSFFDSTGAVPTDIEALQASDLAVLGTTTPAGAATVADSTFGVVESVIVQALKTLQLKSTVLGISRYDSATGTVDVMLGWAEGWFSNTSGRIATAVPVINAQAFVTTAGAAPTNIAGALVSVLPGAITFNMDFAAFNGTMPIASYPLDLDSLPDGASPGSATDPMGLPGFYPSELAAT